jgi:hypothetical protein
MALGVEDQRSGRVETIPLTIDMMKGAGGVYSRPSWHASRY